MSRAFLVLLAFVLSPVSPALAAEAITGRWITQEKDAMIAIRKCGKAFCGTLERFLIAPPGGKDQRDANNADPAKRNRRLVGTTILSNLKADADVWRGQIYDPKSGRTYTSEVRRKAAGVLEVKGCLGLFCQTQLWKSAS